MELFEIVVFFLVLVLPHLIWIAGLCFGVMWLFLKVMAAVDRSLGFQSWP